MIQQQQLDLYRRILAEVEESVTQREYTLQRDMHFYQEAVRENVSAELAEQKQVLVHEAEQALLQERTRHSTLKTEYVQHLTHCQDQAQAGLHNTNLTFQNLQYSCNQQEQLQVSLNERIQSMQQIIENQNKLVRQDVRQMQEKSALSAQEMKSNHRVAENHMVLPLSR